MNRPDIASKSFDHLMETAADQEAASRKIANLYLEHAHSLRDAGHAEDMAASLEQARQLYEQLLQSGSANPGDAAGLADVLVVDGDPLADVQALTSARLVLREGKPIRTHL